MTKLSQIWTTEKKGMKLVYEPIMKTYFLPKFCFPQWTFGRSREADIESFRVKPKVVLTISKAV